jgi:uncharacterized protein with LGFP repeats
MQKRHLISVVTATTVALAGAAIVAVNLPGNRTGSTGAAPPPPPIQARMDTVDLTPAGPTATSVDLPERPAGRFSMLGITWTDPKAVPAGEVQVRTRAAGTGTWTDWKTLDTDERGGEDTASARGGTAPLWVGASDGVAARILSPAGKAVKGLPAGLRLNLIDPTPKDGAKGGSGGQGGGEPGPSESVSEPEPEPQPSQSEQPPAPLPSSSPEPSPSQDNPAPSPTAVIGGLPPYVSRARWAADETLVRNAPGYASDVKVFYVHHTAGTNDYDCADSAAIVRGILAYQVNGELWSDIGYNFLVDKCGTLFEGRRGGVDKAVIGAHTYGFNTGSAAIAVLGTYLTVPVPPVTQTVIAQVAAYKLGMYGYDPSTTAKLTEGVSDGKFPLGQVVTFNRVSGHRDAVATQCPGDALYAQLPAIRKQASSAVFGLTVNPVAGYVRGSVALNWTVGTPTSLLSRFDLVVDGQNAGATPAEARSASLKLADGVHKVSVRAVHQDGSTMIAYAGTVTSDSVGPRFTRAPEVMPRVGTVSPAAVPVTLSWAAVDNVKMAGVRLTAPAAKSFAPTSVSFVTTAVPLARVWRMIASDAAGNTTATAVTRTPVLVAESGAKKAGSWTAKSSSAYLNGKALTTTKRNATLTFTITGRSAGLIMAKSATAGKADILVDGRRVGTVDLRARAANRQIVWARAFSGSTRHTITVVALGGAISVDGLAYIK